MSQQLVASYDRARHALAEAKTLKEVKAIRDKAVAIEVYAKLAKDQRLIADAVELRKEAERHGGLLMEAHRKAGLLAKGRPKKGFQKTHLAQRGIDKNLADRMRKEAAKSQDKFEADVAKAKQIAVAAADDNKAVVTAAREQRHKDKKQQRDQKERALGNKLLALPQKRYGVILADPEWKFKFFSEKGQTNSSADNHYSTSDLEAIKARDVGSIAADDCVLFLWATAPMLPQALEVMAAWGFTYKSNASWTKHKAGTGYWFRNKHEHLLLGVRGKPPCPAEGDQWESVFEASAGKHSAKPEIVCDMIDAYFPTLPKIELNQRTARKDWDGWGDEAPVAEAAA